MSNLEFNYYKPLYENVLAKLEAIKFRIIKKSSDLAFQSVEQDSQGSGFADELMLAKQLIANGKAEDIDRRTMRFIFTNPGCLDVSDFVKLIEYRKNDFAKYSKFLIRGWSQSRNIQQHLAKLQEASKKDITFQPPSWLSDWNNLVPHVENLKWVIQKNKFSSKQVMENSNVVASKFKRSLYMYSLYLEDLPFKILKVQLEEQSKFLPLYRALASGDPNAVIEANIESTLFVGLILRCRVNTSIDDGRDELDSYLNALILNNNIGDPRMRRDHYFWKEVREFASDAYADWISQLNTDDYNFFFTEEVMGKLDEDRVTYWRQYLNQMVHVQVVLTRKLAEDLNRRFGGDEEKMRALRRVQYYKPNAQFSSAFFFFKNDIFIENHDTGAACYHITREQFANKIKNLSDFNRYVHLDFMPRGYGGRDQRLPHNPKSWDAPEVGKFDKYLRNLGIVKISSKNQNSQTKSSSNSISRTASANNAWANQKSVGAAGHQNSTSVAVKNDKLSVAQTKDMMAGIFKPIPVPTNSTPLGATSPSSSSRSILEQNISELRERDLGIFLRNEGLEIRDLRKQGGSLWVLDEKAFSERFEPLLTKYGFKFRHSLGGNATNGKPAWYYKNKN